MRLGGQSHHPSGAEVDELLGTVDLDAYADTLLALVTAEVPFASLLCEDVRLEVLRPTLRDLGVLIAETLRGAPATVGIEDRALNGITDIMVVWGLSLDDLVVVVSLAGRTFAERLFRNLADHETLALLERARREPGVLSQLNRLVAEAANAVDDGRSSRELRARARLLRPRPTPDAPRYFAARIPQGSLRAHADLAATLRSDGLEALTGPDHVFGEIGTATPDLPDAATILVVDAQPRHASPDRSRQRLLEIVDTAERAGLSGTFDDWDLLPHQLLLRAPRERAALARRIERLRASGESVLTAVEQFLRDGGVADAAATLGVHRETLRGRLRRAQKVAGVDLSRIEGRSILMLAALGASLEAPTAAAPAAGPGPGESRPGPRTVPALSRVDADAVATRVQRHLAAHAPAAAERTLEALRDGVLQALELLGDPDPSASLPMDAGSTRRFGALTVDGAHEICAGAQTIVLAAAIDEASREERLGFGPIVARHWSLTAATHQGLQLRRATEHPSADDFGLLLDGLATGSISRTALAMRAHRVDIDIDLPYRALVVVFAGEPQTASAFAMSLRATGWAARARADTVEALVPAEASENALRSVLSGRYVAAAGDRLPFDELEGLFPQLRRTVSYAAAHGARGLLELDDYAVELLLLRTPTLAARVHERVFTALTEHDERRNGDLATTLKGFLAGGLSRASAAAALHLHPNSVDYRLRTIERLTQLSFRHPPDVLLMSLAVTAHELLPALPGDCRSHPADG